MTPENALYETSLGDFLRETASSSPTPGGGSVSALAGALSGALSTMVASLTAGKEGFEDVKPEMDKIATDAYDSAEKLAWAIAKDAEAFDGVMAAYGLPKSTEEEKSARRTAIQSAMKHAAEVPLSVAKNARLAAGFAKTVLDKGNPNTCTDAAVAWLLALTSIEGACLNVAVNLDAIKDQQFVTEYKTEVAKLLEDCNSMRVEIWQMAKTKIKSLP